MIATLVDSVPPVVNRAAGVGNPRPIGGVVVVGPEFQVTHQVGPGDDPGHAGRHVHAADGLLVNCATGKARHSDRLDVAGERLHRGPKEVQRLAVLLQLQVISDAAEARNRRAVVDIVGNAIEIIR